MTGAVLAMAQELAVEPVLDTIVNAARDLTNARYAALGIPDGEGGFAQFLTSGMTEHQIAAIGPLPRTHGMLAAMLQDSAPYRTDDVQQDARFLGWPRTHPDMRSFMGIPIASKGEIIGAFYLTEKRGGSLFTDADQRLIQMLAAHAAIAITNARLYERSRELSVVEERNRLARDLHDAVAQRLFSAALTAEAASTLIDREPERAKQEIQKLQELTRDAMQEMRSLIFELRPAELEADGLVPTLRKHIDVLRRVYHSDIDIEVDGDRRLKPRTEAELFRIAQEGLNNALKHAQAGSIAVRLSIDGERASLSVRDDGVGFDPGDTSLRSHRLGLTSMQERAEGLGGVLRVDSQQGRGTEVCVEVPLA
ncbi:MAG: GAF domain-containing sensor histidine kinase [Dehalococcoidia bacterium]